MTDLELLNLAKSASENSYSPYSQFAVGAALLTKDGTVYKGTNIENASYGLTVCAERVAIFKAISEGVDEKDIIALAIWSNSNEVTTPCGACLQVLNEFLTNESKIICSDGKDGFKVFKLNELLPFGFNKEHLK